MRKPGNSTNDCGNCDKLEAIVDDLMMQLYIIEDGLEAAAVQVA